ncbi:MAG TPA: hypothetical protein VGF47_11015 [Solirubrobacteraceae bacterium]|jgi:hypothetical protein
MAAAADRQPQRTRQRALEAEPPERRLELAERRLALAERRFALTERRFTLLIYGVLLALTTALVIVAIVCALSGGSTSLSSVAAGPGAVAAMRLVLTDRAKR